MRQHLSICGRGLGNLSTARFKKKLQINRNHYLKMLMSSNLKLKLRSTTPVAQNQTHTTRAFGKSRLIPSRLKQKWQRLSQWQKKHT